MGLYLNDSALSVFFCYSPKTGKGLEKRPCRTRMSRRNLEWALLEITFMDPQLSLGEKECWEQYLKLWF